MGWNGQTSESTVDKSCVLMEEDNYRWRQLLISGVRDIKTYLPMKLTLYELLEYNWLYCYFCMVNHV